MNNTAKALWFILSWNDYRVRDVTILQDSILGPLPHLRRHSRSGGLLRPFKIRELKSQCQINTMIARRVNSSLGLLTPACSLDPVSMFELQSLS